MTGKKSFKLDSFPEKQLLLKDVTVNPANYRHIPVPSEELAIQWILNNKGKSTFSLAKDIIEKGRMEQLPIILRKGGKNLVWEGNRRIAGLKVVANPALCLDKKLEKRFRALKDSMGVTDNLIIRCHITNDEDAADDCVENLHTTGKMGTGREGWSAYQQDIFRKKRNPNLATPVVQVRDWLRDLGVEVPPTSYEAFKRLCSKASLESLGLGLDANNVLRYRHTDPAKVLSIWTNIVEDFNSPGFNVTKKLGSKADKAAYIAQISNPLGQKRVDGKRIKDVPQKSKVSYRASGKAAKIRNLQNRDTLIPPGTLTYVKRGLPHKVHQIVKELKEVNINSHYICVGILFRCLLEAATNVYEGELKKTSGGVLCSSAYLKDRLNAIVDKEFSANTQLQTSLKNRISSKDSITSIQVINQIVHNEYSWLSPGELKTSWDHYQPLVCLILEAPK